MWPEHVQPAQANFRLDDGGRTSCEPGTSGRPPCRSRSRRGCPARALPKAEAVVVGDVATIAGVKDLASQANAPGRFDAVIHNAAVGYREGHRVTSDGLPHIFAIVGLRPDALVERPTRLVYLSSGMHHHANANLDGILWKKRRHRQTPLSHGGPYPARCCIVSTSAREG